MAYKKILVPLDGSVFSERALGPAIDLARTMDAAVHLVTVFDGHLEAAFRELGEDEHLEPLEAARAHLSGESDEVTRHGLVATTDLVVSRHTADAIVRETEAVEADLIVMTTHGRSGVSRWLLGSVAEKVLRASPVPVLLCPVRTD